MRRSSFSQSRALRGARALSSGGFTLIELVVVVVILGILAAIAAVMFRSHIANSQDTVAMDSGVKLMRVASGKAVGSVLDESQVSFVVADQDSPSATMRLPHGRKARAVFVAPAAASDPATASADPSTFSVAFAEDAYAGSAPPKTKRVVAVAVVSESGNCVLSVISTTGQLLSTVTLAPFAAAYQATDGSSVLCSGASAAKLLSPAAVVVDPVATQTSSTSTTTTTAPAATTPAAPAVHVPLAPSAVVGAGVIADSGSSVVLSWSAPYSGDPVVDYLVSAFIFDPVANARGAQVGSDVVVTDVTATVPGLSTGQAYQFDVLARNAVGSSAPVTVTVQAPSAPDSLTISGAPGGVATLSWAPVTGATRYAVYRQGADAKGIAYAVDSSLPQSWATPDSYFSPGTATPVALVDAPATQYVDSLPSSGKMVYKVAALNGRGETLSLSRVPLSAVKAGDTLSVSPLLGQGGSLICKNASGTGGLYFLAIGQTAGLAAPVTYSVGPVSGVFDPSSGRPGVIISYPANTVGAISIKDQASGATLASKPMSASFGGATQKICP